MPKSDAQASAATAPVKTTPSHVILTEDCGQWLAGRVFPAAMIPSLDEAKAKYREASPRERGLAGFSV